MPTTVTRVMDSKSTLFDAPECYPAKDSQYDPKNFHVGQSIYETIYLVSRSVSSDLGHVAELLAHRQVLIAEDKSLLHIVVATTAKVIML